MQEVDSSSMFYFVLNFSRFSFFDMKTGQFHILAAHGFFNDCFRVSYFLKLCRFVLC